MNELSGMRLERTAEVAILTLDKPPANTWTVEGLNSLLHVVQTLGAEPYPPPLIITGAGERFFSAGADIKSFPMGGDMGAAGTIGEAFGAAFLGLSDYPGLSCAAINGYAMGGGLECALACDFRLAEEHATLALPEGRIGVLPCGGGTQLLPHLVGESWAKRMILLGERLDAATALRIGLVDDCVSKGTGVDAAVAWLARAKSQSPTSVRICKRLIQANRRTPVNHNWVQEREAFVELFAHPDTVEGLLSFLEKREPRWGQSH